MYLWRLTGEDHIVFDEDWALDQIPLEPDVLAVEYRSVAFATEIVCRLGERWKFYIDNNFGQVFTSDDFLANARDPQWNWNPGRSREDGSIG